MSSETPSASSAAVTVVMKANRRADTKPELRLRSTLHRMGLRFRKDFLIRHNDRKCRPDVVFTKRRLAVFVDGCFWHHCPIHGQIPASNTAYWVDKIRRNQERDKLDSQMLHDAGWHVMRFWEHEPVEYVAEKIREYMQSGL